MKKLVFAAAALLLTACASAPTGPGILVLPGTGKNFDQFRFDDHECRQYAHSQVGGKTADQAATDAGVKSAVVGAAVGTLAGAAIGGNSGAAGVGAGVGLAVGALAGTGASQATGQTLQQRYDFAFTQCMYAKGHKVPVSGRYQAPRASSQGARTPPPPPPGRPPAEIPPDYRVN